MSEKSFGPKIHGLPSKLEFRIYVADVHVQGSSGPYLKSLCVELPACNVKLTKYYFRNRTPMINMQHTHRKEQLTSDEFRNPTSFRIPHSHARHTVLKHSSSVLRPCTCCNTPCGVLHTQKQTGQNRAKLKGQVQTNLLIPAARNIVQLRIFCFEVLPARPASAEAMNFAGRTAFIAESA